MTHLEHLGAWVAGSGEISPRLNLHVLDSLGAWLAGRRTHEGAELASLCAGALPVLGPSLPDRVALRVGTTRLSEIDDIHLPSCVTPGAIVVSTALAVAGEAGVAAADFAQAVRAGYGVMTWLGQAVDGPRIIYRGIWPTYLLAPLGAAAVTARLLGLDAAATANALALALSMVSGGAANPGDISPRWLLAGLAARAGCQAALAARRGFAGDLTLLDCDWLARTHGIAIAPEALALMPPDDGAVSELSMKPHCAAKQTMAASTGMADLLKAGMAPENIAAIRLLVAPPYAGMVGHHITSHRTARLTGAPYQLAVAAWAPDSLRDLERPDLTGDPRIADLLGRITVEANESLAEYYPVRWPARLEVEMQNGSRLDQLVVEAVGDPGRPLSERAVLDKFDQLAGVDAELAALGLAATSDGQALRALCQKLDAI
jgi:2-methylcitrate dehydratase PrpD